MNSGVRIPNRELVDIWIRGLNQLVTVLNENERRTLYSKLVETMDCRKNISALLEKSNIMPSVKRDKRKIIAWSQIIRTLSYQSPVELKRSIWRAYEWFVSRDRSKILGQYFTPPRVARFALSALTKNPNSILDPMAGNCVFLQEAQNLHPQSALVGVDIDSLPLRAAKLVLDKSVRLIEDDVFLWASRELNENKSMSFSAIVGNPAYVSYQNLNLIPRMVGNRGQKNNYRILLTHLIEEISRHRDTRSSIQNLLKKWSGLSDLSAYAILLSWLLLEDGGELVFVTSNHWMEREYGSALRKFLASEGIVKAIVRHRKGNWFPRAQVPASIFVYSKGRSTVNNIPHKIPVVEINAPADVELKSFLDQEVNGEFWGWLGSIHESGTIGRVTVTFRDWGSTNSTRFNINHQLQLGQLPLPDIIRSENALTLSKLGWVAHQGLRTGCNQVFYFKNAGKESWIGERTINGTKTATELNAPASLFLPAIRKIRPNSPLVIQPNAVDTYFLNLQERITPSDYMKVNGYPKDWIQHWNVQSSDVVSHEIENYLNDWCSIPYEGKGGKRGPVFTLSAIRPNIRIPARNQTGAFPKRPRFWYQVPISKRHFGRIIVPRVSFGASRAYLVESPARLVIDANFITLVPTEKSIDPILLWAWFNSNSFHVIAETYGVPMGGGALKLESALLNRLPVDTKVAELDVASLQEILISARRAIDEEGVFQIGYAIDCLLAGVDGAQRNMDRLQKQISLRSD